MHIARYLRHVHASQGLSHHRKTAYRQFEAPAPWSVAGWARETLSDRRHHARRFGEAPAPFSVDGWYRFNAWKREVVTGSYVRTHDVWRLNTRTGEYRKRTVRRRVKYMRGHRGFLSVNDGVATARDIARLVAYHRDPVDWFDLPDERPFEDRARDLHIARAQRRPRSSAHSADTSSARSSE